MSPAPGTLLTLKPCAIIWFAPCLPSPDVLTDILPLYQVGASSSRLVDEPWTDGSSRAGCQCHTWLVSNFLSVPTNLATSSSSPLPFPVFDTVTCPQRLPGASTQNIPSPSYITGFKQFCLSTRQSVAGVTHARLRSRPCG